MRSKRCILSVSVLLLITVSGCSSGSSDLRCDLRAFEPTSQYLGATETERYELQCGAGWRDNVEPTSVE